MAILADFSSTENAVLWIPPFRDTAGAIITGDTLTLAIRSTNGNAYTQATSGVTKSQDANGFWKVTISNSTLYAAGGGAGYWTLVATSTGGTGAGGQLPADGVFAWGAGLKEQLRLILQLQQADVILDLDASPPARKFYPKGTWTPGTGATPLLTQKTQTLDGLATVGELTRTGLVVLLGS